MSEKIGRRDVAKRFLTVLGAVAIVPSALVACGGEEEGGASCNDPGSLEANQVTIRDQQSYMEATANAEQRCDNCNFFTAPQSGDCGTCSVLLNSSVNPGGYCNLWAAAS